MAYAMTKRGSLDNCVTYEFICDTIEDMNAIENIYRTIGSIAIVLQGDNGLEVYISGSDKQWNSLSSIGGSSGAAAGLAIHICGQNEVSEGLPDVSEPDETTIYLVPAEDEESGNLYDEYIYVDGDWEKFGSGNTIDLTGYYQKPVNGIPASDLASGVIPDTSIYALKNNSVLTGSLSLNRKENSTVGSNSTTLGYGSTASGSYSYAEGQNTVASNLYAHAEGYGSNYTKNSTTYISGAKGVASHSEGFQSIAGGQNVYGDHAEGYQTQATGGASHSEGSSTIATGNSAHAEGNNTTASGAYSHAEGDGGASAGNSSHKEGFGTNANGNYSHAEGYWSIAQGLYAHAEGYNTRASNSSSHAEGYQTQAAGQYSHAEGSYTIANSDCSHAEGQGNNNLTKTINGVSYSGTGAYGVYSHVEGNETWTTSACAHAEGDNTVASGPVSHAEGSGTTASGSQSHAEGAGTVASGSNSHAEGGGVVASGDLSHAEGANTNATNFCAHAEGAGTTASGWNSHAEGSNTTASNTGSHAEGSGTTASGNNSHAEGSGTTASGIISHAEGSNTIASGVMAHAEGLQTNANHRSQHVFGEYNVSDSPSVQVTEKGNYIEIVGNGTDENARSNARALAWNGNEYLKGDLYVGCDADSVNGSKVATEVYVINATSGYATQAYVNNAIPIKLSQLQNDIQGTIYGFHIDGDESDPAAKVTYLADAVGKTPAHMDFANDKFEYGGWEDAFFMPRPCMLKYDGTVDYYLDPTDYSKKADGTASDVSNTSYEGNAMMEWGRNGKKIWYNIIPEGNDHSSASIYIADYQVNQNYKAYSFIDKNNNYIDHFYTPCYFGTIVNDGSKDVLRSLSGQAGSSRCKNKTATVERTMAQNNGVDWDMEFYCDIVLINLLLVLIGKSTNTQAIFGEGLHTDGSDTVNDSFISGQHDTKGLFYGTNSGAAETYTNAVKVFGMENWYGFMWRKFLGLAAIDIVIKYKMTANTADGSTGTDYKVSNTGSDYNTYLTGNTMPSASGTYIQKMYFDEKQFVPQTAVGTYQQDYCDGLWTNTGVRCAYRGGTSGSGSRVGAFCLGLYSAASFAAWSVGAAPACKPHKVTI